MQMLGQFYLRRCTSFFFFFFKNSKLNVDITIHIYLHIIYPEFQLVYYIFAYNLPQISRMFWTPNVTTMKNIDPAIKSSKNYLVGFFFLTLYNLRIEATHTDTKYNTTLTRGLFPAPT